MYLYVDDHCLLQNDPTAKPRLLFATVSALKFKELYSAEESHCCKLLITSGANYSNFSSLFSSHSMGSWFTIWADGQKKLRHSFQMLLTLKNYHYNQQSNVTYHVNYVICQVIILLNVYIYLLPYFAWELCKSCN